MPLQNWVTILTVMDDVEANLKKGFLENAGIECEIRAKTVQPYPPLSYFDLLVPKEKSEDAREFLRALNP